MHGKQGVTIPFASKTLESMRLSFYRLLIRIDHIINKIKRRLIRI